MKETPLLEVRDLHAYFPGTSGPMKAVHGASFTVREGEVVGLVGESGSGKTITALSVMRLLPPRCYIERGEIFYRGQDLSDFSNVDI